MAKKEFIKKSEARILVYLETADVKNRYIRQISLTLEIGYIYCIDILGRMHAKGWIKKESYKSKTYYHLARLKAPMKEAKEVLK